MALDLTPLERAAERAGLPGLRARMVPHDRRRDLWFEWRGGELLVSERVLDRCPPAEASALLVDAIVLARRRGRARRSTAIGVAVVVLAVFALQVGQAWVSKAGVRSWLMPATAGLFAGLVFLMFWGPTRSAASRLAADDEAVALLGDAVPLVRGFNLMGQEEVRMGGVRIRARPDLHARAERLVRLHRLREAPPAVPGVPAGDG
jgi:hypothetical protein